HKIVRHDVGKNYAIGDTESENSDPEDEHNSELESESTENDEISDIINMEMAMAVVKSEAQTYAFT
ncbi:4328_t:CDS:2, partial [Funneliformis mosseae]